MSKENSKAQILVGCQAWTYDDWKTQRGGAAIFFPLGTRPAEYLSSYAKIFDTVEVNTSFYSIPKLSMVEGWYRQTPDHFIFSLKMPREITHDHQMSEPSFPVVEDFFSRVAALKNKAGVILIQLPGSFKMRDGTIKSLHRFLEFLRLQQQSELRFAIELRSPEWFNPEIFELLAKQNVALCLGNSEFISREKMLEALAAPSADFAYLRFRGPRDLTGLFDHIRRPQDESMDFWSKRVKDLQSQGKRSFVYFSNHFEGHSPGSAMNFRRMLNQQFTTPEDLNQAPSLF